MPATDSGLPPLASSPLRILPMPTARDDGAAARYFTYTDLQQVMAPFLDTQKTMAEDIKRLAQDHVRREDLDALRREMQAGFEVSDQRFTRREVSDLRYEELKARVIAQDEGRREDRKALADLAGEVEERFAEQAKNSGLSMQQWLLFLGMALMTVLGWIATYLKP